MSKIVLWNPVWMCVFFSLLVIQCPSAKKIKWLTVPDRNMEDGFEPSSNTTALKKTDHEESEEEPEPGQQKGRFFQNLFNFGAKPQPENDTAINRVLSGALSNQEGIASLIRDGVDIAKIYGFADEKGTTVILVDNRCKNNCDINLRCVSPTKDTGYFKIKYEDGYILKFVTQDPANSKPWVCQFRNMQSKKRIIKDLYGRGAPKESVNLFEIRDRGILRLDDSTARIDARQPISEW